MKTRTHSRSGLTVVEALIVVVMLVFLAAVLLPALNRPHSHRRIPCMSNLKQITLSFRLFSNDHGDNLPFAVPVAEGGTMEFTNSPNVFLHFQALSNELVTPKVLVCSTDTNRQRASDFLLSGTSSSFNSNTNLSYFVALDGDESKPERLLSGDRNITGAH